MTPPTIRLQPASSVSSTAKPRSSPALAERRSRRIKLKTSPTSSESDTAAHYDLFPPSPGTMPEDPIEDASSRFRSSAATKTFPDQMEVVREHSSMGLGAEPNLHSDRSNPYNFSAATRRSNDQSKAVRQLQGDLERIWSVRSPTASTMASSERRPNPNPNLNQDSNVFSSTAQSSTTHAGRRRNSVQPLTNSVLLRRPALPQQQQRSHLPSLRPRSSSFRVKTKDFYRVKDLLSEEGDMSLSEVQAEKAVTRILQQAHQTDQSMQMIVEPTQLRGLKTDVSTVDASTAIHTDKHQQQPQSSEADLRGGEEQSPDDHGSSSTTSTPRVETLPFPRLKRKLSEATTESHAAIRSRKRLQTVSTDRLESRSNSPVDTSPTRSTAAADMMDALETLTTTSALSHPLHHVRHKSLAVHPSCRPPSRLSSAPVSPTILSPDREFLATQQHPGLLSSLTSQLDPQFSQWRQIGLFSEDEEEAMDEV